MSIQRDTKQDKCVDTTTQGFLNTTQAARYLTKLGVATSKHTLDQYRSRRGKHQNIPHYKIGSRVFYKTDDLRAWVESFRKECE